MTAVMKPKISNTKNNKKPRSKTTKNRRRKKRSIHSNTFEERQENIRKKQEKLDKKQKSKKSRLLNVSATKQVIEKLHTWTKDNPIHPSVVAAPSQIKPKQTQTYTRTYKAFIRNLPRDTTCEEVDEHFQSRGVFAHCIRLMRHRRWNHCLGWGFVEFQNKIEYLKSLRLNISLFRNNERILVEGSLRSFNPSKKKAQKIISFYPTAKTASNEKSDDISNEKSNEKDEIMEIEIK